MTEYAQAECEEYPSDIPQFSKLCELSLKHNKQNSLCWARKYALKIFVLGQYRKTLCLSELISENIFAPIGGHCLFILVWLILFAKFKMNERFRNWLLDEQLFREYRHLWADPRLSLGGGDPQLRNDVTDWWGKSILKANMGSQGGGGWLRILCTRPPCVAPVV